MEAVQTIWSFVLLFSLLVFAQLFGVLFFLLLKDRQHFLAHAVGFVVPLVLSIVFLWMILLYRYYQFHPDDRDGGQLFGASLIILFSACLQLVLGTIAQIVLHSKTDLCRRD